VNIFGSIPAFGSWNVDNAPALSAANYTDANPIWFYTVNLPAGQSFEYKYYVRHLNGSITYESDPNRVYTVPANCAGTADVNDSFR
jgi:glucoamylase